MQVSIHVIIIACSHKEDLIMECINDDLDNPIPPPEGSLRLMGHDNSPS
jgi:hypothetical protein